jgi:hypothetical protein
MAGTAMGVGWGPRGRWSHVRVHHGAQLTSENSCEWTSFLFLVPKITNTRAHADGIGSSRVVATKCLVSSVSPRARRQEPSCAALRSRTRSTSRSSSSNSSPRATGFDGDHHD